MKAKGFEQWRDRSSARADQARPKRLPYKRALKLIQAFYSPTKSELSESREGNLEWRSVQVGDTHVAVYFTDVCGNPYRLWLFRRDGEGPPITGVGGIDWRELSAGGKLLDAAGTIYALDVAGELRLLTKGASLHGFGPYPLCDEC